MATVWPTEKGVDSFASRKAPLYAAIKHYSALQPALFDEPGNLESVKDNLIVGVKGILRKGSAQ